MCATTSLCVTENILLLVLKKKFVEVGTTMQHVPATQTNFSYNSKYRYDRK